MLRLCLLPLLIVAATAKASNWTGNEAVQSVMARVLAGDCKGATRELNVGLADRLPEIALLAGAMFEQGTCLKPDWNRAVSYYVLAHESGQAPARYRLAAGYAGAVGGRDMAAALWWSHRGAPLVTGACQLAASETDDPDRFVAALTQWPKGRLEACTYVVGVMATMMGEIRYPSVALQYAVTGDVVVQFRPAIPRLDVKADGTEELQAPGWVNGDRLRDRQSRAVTGSFADTVRHAADRALQRYVQPAGIDAGWVISTKYVFTATYAN
ncbi:MAG: hypothetical protein V4508_15475 [Pseudomonadota bacterium]